MRRREFISRLFQLVLGVLLGGRAWRASAAFSERGIFDLGPVSDFPPGTVRHFLYLEAFIISDSQGIYALNARCTHRGGPLFKTEKNDALVCRRHNSRFDLEGKVTRGPAYEPLEWIRLEKDEKGNLILYARYRGERGRKIPHD
jgi:nitrite reductase/ring-hydroxylating ferredoxin subunit